MGDAGYSDAGYVGCSYTMKPYDKCDCIRCEVRKLDERISKLEKSIVDLVVTLHNLISILEKKDD